MNNKRFFKKFLSLILSFVLLFTAAPFLSIITAFAESSNATSGMTGNCTWTIDGTVLTISGKGMMENYYPYHTAPWAQRITKVIIKEGVLNIGDESFYQCRGLISVEMSNSIKEIGELAFSGCKELKNITLPNSLTKIDDYSFQACESLTNIIIPENVTSIGKSAFRSCENLSNVSLSKNVSIIESTSFSFCSNLMEIKVPLDNPYFYTKNNCLIEKKSKKLIRGCNNSTIPDDGSITLIGNYAFSGCSKLDKVIIPSEITSIGEEAFRNCFNLTKVFIPDSVTSIHMSSFDGTSSDLRIFASENSAAHIFAKSYNKKFYLTKIVRFINSPEVERMESVEKNSVCIILKPTENYEYKCNNGKWQKSNVFENLSFDEDYTFYQRLGETDENVASSASEAAIIHTKKKNLSVPNPPEVISKTAFSITLKQIAGYEYSLDGLNWQISNIFNGLKSFNEYTFYQRIAETDEFPATIKSNGLTVKTLKLQNDSVPNKPTLISKTDTSITLQSVEGYEYSIDGVNWQKEPTFKNLNPETEYAIYQRISETETTYPSGNSDPIIVKTYPEHYCSDCLNKGYNEETVICKKCNGSGKILNGYFYTCPKCELRVIENITGYGTYYTCGKCGFLSRADKNASYIGCTLCKATGKVTEKVKCKTCNGTGVLYIPGDLDGDEGITDSDVLYLLKHTFRPEKYPVNQPCDYDGDGMVTDADAVYLLKHIFRPDKYPLSK